MLIAAAVAVCRDGGARVLAAKKHVMDENMELPAPNTTGSMTIEQAIAARRSVRAFGDGPPTLGHLSQILWAAQGETGHEGLRAAPSAGALYPIELYVLVGDVLDLAPGIYKYIPDGHRLVHRHGGDLRAEMARLALGQSWIADSRAIIVCAAEFSRTTGKYGDRGERYVHMEVGHVGQNVYLQATALGYGTTIVGAFDDAAIHRLVGLGAEERPLSLLPLGRLPA